MPDVVLLLAAVTDGDLSLVARALPIGTEIDLQAAADARLVTLSAGRARFRHPTDPGRGATSAGPTSHPGMWRRLRPERRTPLR
ncbi:hypothetical protein V3N99_07380 [Dermatophilaceae bacterium Soc4.6]